MASPKLSPRPCVPVLIHAAAVGAAMAGLGGSACKLRASDMHPTDPCGHQPEMCQEAEAEREAEEYRRREEEREERDKQQACKDDPSRCDDGEDKPDSDPAKGQDPD